MKGKARMLLTVTISFFLLNLIFNLSAHSAHISTKNKIQFNKKQILIVDKNNNSNYNSISEAIKDAVEQDTIYVKNGEYREIIDIKKTIRLIGEDKENTVINPISNKNKYAVRLEAPEIVLKGFNITNGASGIYTSAIRVTSSKNTISECNIYNVPIGIAIWTSENTIKKCTFCNCQDEGIAFLGSKHTNCEKNYVENCKFYENCDGIELQYSSNNRIEKCEFFRNTHSGIDAIKSSNNNNTFINCKIYDNLVNGIYLSGSNNNKIIDCEVRDNIDGDIMFSSSSKNNIVSDKNVREKIINLFNSISQIFENKTFKSNINNIF